MDVAVAWQIFNAKLDKQLAQDNIFELDNELARDLIAIEQRRVEEAVFERTFIPSSLQELGTDAHKEQKRLVTGQREPAFAAAVMSMIASNNNNNNNNDNNADPESQSTESDDEEDDDSEGDGEDGEETGDAKYRRCLPSRDNVEARNAEKQARKEARKLAKEAAATKRQNKIPKHVKKRAMKTSKR